MGHLAKCVTSQVDRQIVMEDNKLQEQYHANDRYSFIALHRMCDNLRASAQFS